MCHWSESEFSKLTAQRLSSPIRTMAPTARFVKRRSYARNPDKYFYADQYSNDANWQAHYHTTANEIWQQTEGRVTHFVATLGTSGTFMGCTRRLRELNPRDQMHLACSRIRHFTDSKV